MNRWQASRLCSQITHTDWSGNRRTLVEAFLLKAIAADIGYGYNQFIDYILLGSNSKPITVEKVKL
jgi:type I restriction enzyme R subunit